MLKDSIIIDRTANEVFDWLMNFVENYQSWHPDHIFAKWLKGKDFEIGSILYTEERIGNTLEKLKFKTTKLIPNRLIEYKLMFPESMICSGGSFQIEPKNGSVVFTATLSFRFEFILKRLFILKVQDIMIHMKEEGENLKNILEENKNVLNKK